MSGKYKLLYVDDEVINLQLFKINMENDYDVFIAYDGINGLQVLDEHKDIDIIFSDMKMPEMNGIEFITKVKEQYPDKKCFILTGFEITDEIKEALNSGLILKYFSKPFNIDEIQSTLQAVV